MQKTARDQSWPGQCLKPLNRHSILMGQDIDRYRYHGIRLFSRGVGVHEVVIESVPFTGAA